MLLCYSVEVGINNANTEPKITFKYSLLNLKHENIPIYLKNSDYLRNTQRLSRQAGLFKVPYRKVVFVRVYTEGYNIYYT